MTRLGVLLCALSAASPAWAYEFICRGWDITGYSGWCPTGVRDNSDSCGCAPSQVANAPKWYGAQVAMSVENQGGNGITSAQFVQATRNAAKSWTDITCSVFQMDATTTVAATSTARWGTNDSEHGVFYVVDSTEWYNLTGSGPGGALGVTLPGYWGGCGGREFYDADVIINGLVQDGWTPALVEHVLLHELGHVLGLGHPCLSDIDGCSNICQAVMSATGVVNYTTPQQDDINGLCALYPGTPGGLGSSCTAAGQCNSGLCITYQGFSYCSQTCGTCPTGYECRLVNAQNVCVRQGAPAVGQPCTSICEAGALCVDTGGGGMCYRACDPNAANPGCLNQDRCVELQGGGGICWPPGTQQVGEPCAGSYDDCAAGLACIGDTPNVDYGHCYLACDGANPESCGSDWLCLALDPALAICLAAAQPGGDCQATDGVCVAGYTCVGVAANDYDCLRECNYNDPASCGPGQTCLTLVDQNNQPVGGACFSSGDAQEGDLCISFSDCGQGLLCVSNGSNGECLVLCDPQAPNCPHTGQTCEPLSGSGDGVCYPAGGTGGGGGGGGGSRGYLQTCTQSSECRTTACQSDVALCATIPGYNTVCTCTCNPRLGHYDCPAAQDSGCEPTDPASLVAGGTCQPGITANASAELGEACDQATGYRECLSGLCDDGTCLTWCTDGTCPAGYECDDSELVVGICREAGGGCGCGPTGATRPGPLWALLFAAVGWLKVRERRPAQRRQSCATTRGPRARAG